MNNGQQSVDLFSVIGRLQTENMILKDRVAQLEGMLTPQAGPMSVNPQVVDLPPQE